MLFVSWLRFLFCSSYILILLDVLLVTMPIRKRNDITNTYELWTLNYDSQNKSCIIRDVRFIWHNWIELLNFYSLSGNIFGSVFSTHRKIERLIELNHSHLIQKPRFQTFTHAKEFSIFRVYCFCRNLFYISFSSKIWNFCKNSYENIWFRFIRWLPALIRCVHMDGDSDRAQCVLSAKKITPLVPR